MSRPYKDDVVSTVFLTHAVRVDAPVVIILLQCRPPAPAERSLEPSHLHISDNYVNLNSALEHHDALTGFSGFLFQLSPSHLELLLKARSPPKLM
jgi:hypothetical protein